MTVWAVFSQKIKASLVPVVFATYEKEYLACLGVMEKFVEYIETYNFWKSNNPVGRLARWLVRLTRFKFNVQYIKGTENFAVDCLSRLECSVLMSLNKRKVKKRYLWRDEE
ncbi:hypothetical protein PR048_008447 [Dryococelus australis]|uniref:Reverse transcriptase RNase H-like domain-containing protein n=1 Tax=Dryococelus australis TaxID=614101 RepID=A0ABQ9HYV5_9NEOP|nr:hypothetical protein PR048_008447 [Dryococelus australis]